MIQITKVRLINWYGFSNVSAPIGQFTLIAGKNGNGKSVLLAAMKYWLYGDTVFNKSSESKGGRTLSSYTRGLLDATAGTYMRPPEKIANVYTHVVLEFYDDLEEKPFLLGCIIETSAANNCQTYRYAMDRTVMEEVDHTYPQDGAVMPYNASGFQKRYGVTLMDRTRGLPKFLQMTGLKLDLAQLPTFLRKLRGIMSYDPDAKIDRFIRDSVLEERKVDLGKLIDAKNNIDDLSGNFQKIQEEIDALDGILQKYDAWEHDRDRVLTDDIRILYKSVQDLTTDLRDQTTLQASAKKRKEDLEGDIRVLEERDRQVGQRLMEANLSLKELDVTRSIEAAQSHLHDLQVLKKELHEKCRKLDQFQDTVNELMNCFFQAEEQFEDKSVLASLCDITYTVSQKTQAVAKFKERVQDLYDDTVDKIGELRRQREETDRALQVQDRILEDCRKHRNAYDQIPDAVGLRNDINRELEKRGIEARAQFACEYVIKLEDESWRDAIETFLGGRRYTILVDPAYYDIADEVLNHSEHKYAHLFNTKLLMRKQIEVVEDSVVAQLEIRNPVAQQYFDYQLGRMHGVDKSEVRNYENAISKEGRVSVAMDSYFLRIDRLRYYYLGQETFALNEKRAQREIERLEGQKQEIYARQKELDGQRARIARDRDLFQDYDYESHKKYQETAAEETTTEKQVQDLIQAQKDDQAFIELSELAERLRKEQEAIHKDEQDKYGERSAQDTIIERTTEKIATESEELKVQEARFQAQEREQHDLVQTAVAGYVRFLANGSKGLGGILSEKGRNEYIRSMEQGKSELMQLQADYNARYSQGNILPRGTDSRRQYAARREHIWMDDLQDVRHKLDEQTRRYEDIFKNEFVLTILKSCEQARDDLRGINIALDKLHFSAKYQFDVHYVRDSSDYSKIIAYARYLDEREQMGDWMEGQMSLDGMTSVSNEEGERLEAEMQRIVDRMIEENSQETIEKLADYRNYMTYEILMSNQVLDRAKLSRQTGFNSGAEVQIPYLLILTSALLMIYDQRVNSTRLVFIDEPFAKMDPGNVKIMLGFLREQGLQVIFCSPDKTESIGNACEVLLPVLRPRPDNMLLGVVQFHEGETPSGTEEKAR